MPLKEKIEHQIEKIEEKIERRRSSLLSSCGSDKNLETKDESDDSFEAPSEPPKLDIDETLTSTKSEPMKSSKSKKRDSLGTTDSISSTKSEGHSKASITSNCSKFAPPHPAQAKWEALSVYLQKFDLRSIKELPCDLDLAEHEGCPELPVNEENDESKPLTKITVEKRFSSRKQPHFLRFHVGPEEEYSFIYKQDDDIAMDVVVMKLFRKCNDIWKLRDIRARCVTYNIIACSDKTGFGEVVNGETMFNFHAIDLFKDLGRDIDKWERFYQTLVATIVTTAIFDISDRHHNNIMWTPDCEIALIDLSASLGLKTSVDSTLKINPIYFPKRAQAMLSHFNLLNREIWHLYEYERDIHDLEEAVIVAFFAVFNDRNTREFCDCFNYKMLKPVKFLEFFGQRANDYPQAKEKLRNELVRKMDEDKNFSSFVFYLGKVIDMN